MILSLTMICRPIGLGLNVSNNGVKMSFVPSALRTVMHSVGIWFIRSKMCRLGLTFKDCRVPVNAPACWVNLVHATLARARPFRYCSVIRLLWLRIMRWLIVLHVTPILLLGSLLTYLRVEL